MKVALQLYSLRTLAEKDFFAMLDDVKKAGFDGVEFAGYFDVPADKLKSKLESLGLEAAGSHVGYERLINHLDEEIEYAKTLGLYSVVCPGADISNMENLEKAAAVFNKAGKKFKENGIIFGYHNHAAEFEKIDGKYALDLLYEKTSPEYVTSEIDTYWVRRGGENPVTYCKKYADRMYLLHAKDMYEDGKDSNIGEGCIDFKAITGELPRLEWAIVEQEAFEGDPVECVAVGCKNLKNL